MTHLFEACPSRTVGIAVLLPCLWGTSSEFYHVVWSVWECEHYPALHAQEIVWDVAIVPIIVNTVVAIDGFTAQLPLNTLEH